jgi:hypothetical protein
MRELKGDARHPITCGYAIQRGRDIVGAMLKFTPKLSDERGRLFLIL